MLYSLVFFNQIVHCLIEKCIKQQQQQKSLFIIFWDILLGAHTGLSMNILYAGDKLPVQRGFFTNSAGDLLSALGFLGGLYNFCNFVIIFSSI